MARGSKDNRNIYTNEKEGRMTRENESNREIKACDEKQQTTEREKWMTRESENNRESESCMTRGNKNTREVERKSEREMGDARK